MSASAPRVLTPAWSTPVRGHLIEFLLYCKTERGLARADASRLLDAMRDVVVYESPQMLDERTLFTHIMAHTAGAGAAYAAFAREHPFPAQECACA